ncbi:MAG: hypothetical protein QOI95_2110 [Acidimicrobiaceae bacterium]|jgi:hypothetical protein
MAQPTLAPQQASRVRAAAIGWGSGPSGPVRRNRGRILGGVVLVVIGGWVAASVFLSVGRRVEVLAVARPVPKYAAISRDDLKVVRVAADPDVHTIKAGELDHLVGRVTSAELATGSLLNDVQLLPAGERVIKDGEAEVGTLLGAGDAPDSIARGDKVQVIVRPPLGQTGATKTIDGWVADVSTDKTATGERRVALVVPVGDASSVSAASAEKRVSVVVVGG